MAARDCERYKRTKLEDRFGKRKSSSAGSAKEGGGVRKRNGCHAAAPDNAPVFGEGKGERTNKERRIMKREEGKGNLRPVLPQEGVHSPPKTKTFQDQPALK